MQNPGSLMVGNLSGPCYPQKKKLVFRVVCTRRVIANIILFRRLWIWKWCWELLSLYNSLTSHIRALTPRDDTWRKNLGGCLGWIGTWMWGTYSGVWGLVRRICMVPFDLCTMYQGKTAWRRSEKITIFNPLDQEQMGPWTSQPPGQRLKPLCLSYFAVTAGAD